MAGSSTADLLEEGLALHRRGAIAEAAARYAEVLRADPGNADANYYLGMMACQQGRFAEGAEQARRALSGDPRHVRAHVLMGRALNALDRCEEALESLAHAIALAPDFAQAHGHRADLLSELGRYDEAVESYDKALALAPDVVADLFNRGAALAELGRRDDALASFDRAIAVEPDFADAHLRRAKLLSDFGRLGEALEAADNALAINPDVAEAWLGRANILSKLDRSEDAFTACNRALALKPNLPEAWLAQGHLHRKAKRRHDALAACERALALQPDFVDAWLERGVACIAIGDLELAVEAARRALELRESDETRGFFAHCIKLAQPAAEAGSQMYDLVLRTLSEGWMRPRDLASACISIIKRDVVVNDLIDRVNAAWPTRSFPTQLHGPPTMTALSNNKLLCCLLECDIVPDIGLERLVTNVRYAMLTSAVERACDDSLLGFYCAVARQCFNNGYIFSTTKAELEEARRLRALLETALESGKPYQAHWPAVVGAYFPLSTLSNKAAMLGRLWPACVLALIDQQIVDPAREREIAKAIPSLTNVEGGVSQVVRQQYEENPFPRWIKAGQPSRSPILDGRRPDEVFDMLIAGCGTGLFAIEFARQARQARILGIDLSVASLSYAQRMAEALQVGNLEFAQADIMKLGAIGRQFDVIDCSGVLHHLADPWQGWRILLSLLRPGGTMQVGLYSRLARRSIVAARALIAVRGYRPTLDDIRRCREEIITSADPALKSVMQWGDFFATDECRDLLFHTQEHQMTIPEIKAFLVANDLEFRGFALDPITLENFTARFPAPEALTDIDCWQEFEMFAPQTFIAMYEFLVRKPSLPADPSPRKAD